jgi:chemotaxis protein MotB
MTTSSHEKAMADLNAQHQSELERVQAQDQADRARAEEQAKANQDLSARLAATQKQLDDLKKLLAGTTADKDKLDKLMRATSSQLEELQRQKAAAEARAATYRSLTERLRSMIDAGQLQVKIRKGRMLISLPNDVLFDSGSAVLKQAGQSAVQKVAQALAPLADRQFLVAGHTDNQPIHTKRFASNWELSTARAVVVTRALVAAGMKPDTLGAVGYGEFDPIVANDTPEHRAQNRRIEIQLQPNLSELPSLENVDQPDGGASSSSGDTASPDNGASSSGDTASPDGGAGSTPADSADRPDGGT